MQPIDDQTWMQLAIEQSLEAVATGQAPFGAVIVRGGQVLASAYNTVRRDQDPTAHAEVNAIRRAARAADCRDFADCTLYTTCEPCPMCLVAGHWARIPRVVYGATVADAAGAGFHQLGLDARALAAVVHSPIQVEPGPLRDECRAVFQLWKTRHAAPSP